MDSRCLIEAAEEQDESVESVSGTVPKVSVNTGSAGWIQWIRRTGSGSRESNGRRWCSNAWVFVENYKYLNGISGW